MDILFDFIFFVQAGIRAFASGRLSSLGLAISVGTALGALSWWACSNFSLLWNRKYDLKPFHHILCALAGALTIFFSVWFFALPLFNDIAVAAVDNWRLRVRVETAWTDTAFRQAYQAVRQLGLEDFSNFPPPKSGIGAIPQNNPQSRLTLAQVYADAALSNWRLRRPFLARVLSTGDNISPQVISADMSAWFATGSQTYPADRAISLVAGQLHRQATARAPRVVWLGRALSILLFFLFQAVLFAIIGHAAYSDIKTASY